MTSNRVGGPTPSDPNKGPDTRTQEQHRKIEKVEKVRAVDEAENEHTRKKFQRLMEDEEPASQPKTPGPLETSFYASKEKSTESVSEGSIFKGSFESKNPLADLGTEIVPSPAYSPPPNLTVPTPPSEEEEETPPLPRGRGFWSNVDSPPDQPPQKPNYKETTEASSKTNQAGIQQKEKAKEKNKKGNLPQKEKESIFGPPGKVLAQTKGKGSPPSEKESQKAKPSSLQAQAAPAPFREEEKKSAKPSTLTTKEAKEGVLAPPPSEEKSHALSDKQKSQKEEMSGEKDNKKKRSIIEIEEPSLSPLPASVVPMAQAAAVAATPYLSPETIPLFFQMVGTIYMMSSTPGVSTTEIVLNSPGFANSRFFGSTISIVKYATAPDSLNIRLSGTDEAVRAFNQNIPNLYAAFQNGNFNFRIGRIDAEYSVEKPIFRRKEPGREKGESGEGRKDRR